jgi:NitT/TauT family transport system permease protein
MGAQAIRDRVSRACWWLFSIGLFFGAWELTYAMGLYSAQFLPPPHIFLADFPNQIQHFDSSNINAGEAVESNAVVAILRTSLHSIQRVLAGLGMGFVLGVIVGTLIRYFHVFGKLLLPAVTLLAPISPFAWLPVAVYLFGTGNGPAIFMVFVAVFFIIVLATIAEIDAVSATYLKVARILGASNLQTYTQVILPAMLPGLFMMLRLNLFGAWMIVLIAESAGSNSGLGTVVMLARNTGNPNLVMIGMMNIGIIGFLFDVGLRLVQRRLLYWVPELQATLNS